MRDYLHLREWLINVNTFAFLVLGSHKARVLRMTGHGAITNFTRTFMGDREYQKAGFCLVKADYQAAFNEQFLNYLVEHFDYANKVAHDGLNIGTKMDRYNTRNQAWETYNARSPEDKTYLKKKLCRNGHAEDSRMLNDPRDMHITLGIADDDSSFSKALVDNADGYLLGKIGKADFIKSVDKQILNLLKAPMVESDALQMRYKQEFFRDAMLAIPAIMQKNNAARYGEVKVNPKELLAGSTLRSW